APVPVFTSRPHPRSTFFPYTTLFRSTIPVSGAKNAALPLMIASLLTDDTLTLENVPHLADVEQLIRILGNHGVDYSVNGRRENQIGKHTSELQSRENLVCRLLLEKKN